MSRKQNKMSWAAWLVCGLGALFYAYEYLLRITPSAMEMPLRSYYDLTATGFGFLSASYYYAYVPMQLPVGVLMDRFGPRRLLTLACLICIAGTYLFSMTRDLNFALVGRFLVGMGSAFAFVGVLKLATIWLPENKLGMVAGMTSALGTIGAMVGDNVLGGFVNQWGWQVTIHYTALFGVGLIFLLWFGIHDHQRDLESGGTIDSFKRNLVDLFIIIREKQIWINGLYGCLVYLPTTVFGELWGIPYLMHAHGLSESAAGFANSMLFCGFMIGAPTMGFISDKLRRRKLPMRVGAIVAACLMVVVLYVPSLSTTMIYVLMFTLGLFYSAQAIVFAVGRELSPNEAAGTAIATTNMIVMIGAIFVQPMIGRLLDLSVHVRHTIAKVSENGAQVYSAIDYQFAMSVIPMGILIAAILTFFIRETHAHAPK